MGLMRKRLKNFLPVALIALIVQIFAPIGAWSAANIAADPSAAGVVCHGNSPPGSDQSDQTTNNRVHDGCCLVCSVLHTGAPVDPRSPDLIVAFDRNAAPIIWHSFVSVGAVFDGGYPARARAPPFIS
jgi:hypothetical protein